MNGTSQALSRKAAAVALLLIGGAFSAPAFAATSPNTGEAAIVRPLSFVISNNLDFGMVIPSATAGTVTLDPFGARTKTGGVTLVGNTHQAATFAGQGTFNQRVDVSIGSNSFNLTGPGAPMRVHDLVIGSTPTAVLTTTPQRFRIAAANGIFNFPVGATLDVGANQAPGHYSGTYTITLQYF